MRPVNWSVRRFPSSPPEALLAAYPLAMAFALVYTAEHYLVDILLGWAYAVFALWLVNTIADRRAARRASG